MISAFVKLPIKEGRMDDAVAAVNELIAGVKTEEGTLLYTVNTDKKDPNALIIMERYKDKAALEAHGATPHFQAFFAKAAEFIDGQPEMNFYREIASI